MSTRVDLLPSQSIPSSSRAQRPVSEAVFAPSGSASRRPQRVSHAAFPSQTEIMPPIDIPLTYDVYSHPKAIAYQQQHPKRSLPKFGPYLLLQTLGEGEFGKVKLGLHEDWGEEVAVKLIRRGSVDNQVRLSKVEREIEVLKKLKHPNIVRLYDVIETDKYIGIVLEYASGGELFDHILAHRYLREKDACKLFAQLISGVWYTHQKKIVHRDLKLENLLLDRNRNVIITDFGFANRFEHKADDLMVTSCGSPCYAAPELVISEGAYVGSAVDVWSCGVILYAMLAGYLPFDDDPSNPDGDNINLLYKYIVSTTLTFPDYVSDGARNLLGIMLVPEPRKRATLDRVMQHEWLAPYRSLFQRSVDQLEVLAAEAAQQKREAYIKQARAAKQALMAAQQQHMARMARSQTMNPGSMATLVEQRRGGGISGSVTADLTLYEPQQESYSPPPSAHSARRAVASAIVMPSSAYDEDIIMQPAQPYIPSQSDIPQRTRKESAPLPVPTPSRAARPQPAPAAGPPPSVSGSQKRRQTSHRHTVQVEYETPEPEPFPSMPSAPAPVQPLHPAPAPQVQQGYPQRPAPRTPPVLTPAYGQPEIIIPQTSGPGRRSESPANLPPSLPPVSTAPSTPPKSRRPSVPSTPPAMMGLTPRSPNMPPVPNSTPMTAHPPRTAPQISVSSPTSSPTYRRAPATEPALPANARYEESPITPTADVAASPVSASYSSSQHAIEAAMSSGNASASASRSTTTSSRSGHRKGMSTDKFNIAKLLSSKGSSEQMPGQQPQHVPNRGPDSKPPVSGGNRPVLATRTSSGLGPADLSEKEKKKSRRTTLSLMVQNPFSSSTSKEKEKPRPPPGPRTAVPSLGVSPAQPLVTPDYSVPPLANVRNMSTGPGPTASTGAAKQVMSWFRKKSQAKNGAPGLQSFESSTSESPSTLAPPPAPVPKLLITTTAPVEERYAAPPRAPAVAAVPARTAPPRFDSNQLRLHEGAIDQGHVTAEYPPAVMEKVAQMLNTMGIEFSQDTPFRYRCVRQKRKTGMTKSNTGLGFSGMTGPGGAPTSYNGVNAGRNLLPNSAGSNNMLKGLLRRGSSHAASPPPVISPSLSTGSEDSPINAPQPYNNALDAVYGDVSVDKGDEIRFYIELTRLEKLHNTYSLDIRRLKGSLGGYQVVYETLRDRLKLT